MIMMLLNLPCSIHVPLLSLKTFRQENYENMNFQQWYYNLSTPIGLSIVRKTDSILKDL